MTSVLLRSDAADTPTAALPPGVAQVQLRLVGDLTDADSLVAEVVPVNEPDRTKRWPVDAVAAAADGASATVTLPAYALPPGSYVVTVWRGDAEPVQRYPLRIVP